MIVVMVSFGIIGTIPLASQVTRATTSVIVLSHVLLHDCLF